MWVMSPRDVRPKPPCRNRLVALEPAARRSSRALPACRIGLGEMGLPSPRCARLGSAPAGQASAAFADQESSVMPFVPPATDLPLSATTRAFLQGPFPLLIAGVSRPGVAGETLATFDPATGAHLADVAIADAQDVDAAVIAARAAFEGRLGQEPRRRPRAADPQACRAGRARCGPARRGRGARQWHADRARADDRRRRGRDARLLCRLGDTDRGDDHRAARASHHVRRGTDLYGA